MHAVTVAFGYYVFNCWLLVYIVTGDLLHSVLNNACCKNRQVHQSFALGFAEWLYLIGVQTRIFGIMQNLVSTVYWKYIYSAQGPRILLRRKCNQVKKYLMWCSRITENWVINFWFVQIWRTFVDRGGKCRPENELRSTKLCKIRATKSQQLATKSDFNKC